MPVIFILIVVVGSVLIAYLRFTSSATAKNAKLNWKMPKPQLANTTLRYSMLLLGGAAVVVLGLFFSQDVFLMWTEWVEPNMDPVLLTLAGIAFVWALLASGKEKK